MKVISVMARIDIPVEDIVDAVGPEVSKTLISAGSATRKIKHRQPAGTLRTSAEHVVSALDRLEQEINTGREAAARRALMDRVRDLRATLAKLRSI